MLIPASLTEAMTAATSSMVGDAQWVFIFDRFGNELARPVSMRSDSQAWELHEVDLLPFKGQLVQLYFGTFNNGSEGVTALFVDDVSVEICTGYGPALMAEQVEMQIMPDVSQSGISGRLTDGDGVPQPGEIVRLSTGDQTTTDDDGYYSFTDLDGEKYVVIPPLSTTLLYDPPSYTVTIPPAAEGVDFTGLADTDS